MRQNTCAGFLPIGDWARGLAAAAQPDDRDALRSGGYRGALSSAAENIAAF